MRAGAIVGAALLCALPARGANESLSETVIGVLTPIDSVPAPAAIDQAFAPAPALGSLINIARAGTTDLGIQLRAIRALPGYCPADCSADLVHQTLVDLLAAYAPDPAAVQSPADTLRLIAVIEALGATRSGLEADFERLWPLLDLSKTDGHAATCAPRRDVRATAARAIGQICFHDALDALRAYIADPCGQVAMQAGLAVQTLEQCTK